MLIEKRGRYFFIAYGTEKGDSGQKLKGAFTLRTVAMHARVID